MVGIADPLVEEERLCNLIEALTIEDMMQGVSKIRNPVITRVFRELKLMEQWGSGVRRIFIQAGEQNLPAPRIVEIGIRVRFIVPLVTPIPIPQDEVQVGTRTTPDLVFRDPYILDFLGLKDTYAEKDLEAAILREIESFILELGVGFAFIARQKRMTIDNEDHYLDLRSCQKTCFRRGSMKPLQQPVRPWSHAR